MNRNSTAVLATAILFSMLASSGVRPGTQERRGDSSAAQTKATTPTKSNRQPPKLRDPKTAGKTDYGNEIQDDLLLEYCQDGTDEREGTDKKAGTEKKPGADKKGCELTPDNFVIAIVPDPVHTHLALYFDRTIDTIEEALQDDGYIFYEAVVPWDQAAHPEPDDFTLRLAAKQYQKSREKLPGVMLFRPSRDVDAPKDPLAVMLVGESPTGGIDKDQFLGAIARIQDPLGTKKNRMKKDELSLRILGPTFSGSLYSLNKLLTCGTGPCYKSATVLSGAITGREAVDDFRDAISKFQKNETSPPKITFDTFQETDAVMLERFVEFLAGKSYGDRLYDVRQIAELSEDETAYGSLRRSGNGPVYPAESGYCKNPPAPTNPTQSQTAPQSQDRTPSQNAAQPLNLCSILRLYFPREISQLRAAYQDNSSSANGADRLPVQALPHNYGVTGADDDTVASFSQKQTPLSQEAILLSIVAELRKHAIKFVVLNATDPLDTLFLSHYLRSAYPQGRIVTIGADMLFPREVEDTSLHGILALSTYSVAPSANHQFYQLWQSGTERMFPSSNDVGTYNALHSLMTAEALPPPFACDSSVSKTDCTDRLLSILKETRLPDCAPSILKIEFTDRLRNTFEAKKPLDIECADRLWGPFEEKSRAPLYLIQYGWRERGDERFIMYNAPPVRLNALGHDGYWPVANLGPVDLGIDEKKWKTIPTLLPQVVSEPQLRYVTALLPVHIPHLPYWPAPLPAHMPYYLGLLPLHTPYYPASLPVYIPYYPALLPAHMPDYPPQEQFTTAPANIEVPDSWIVMEVAGLALAVGFCVSLWFGSIRSPWQQLAQFAPTMPPARVWLIAAAGVFLVSVLLILLWPFVHGDSSWVIANASRHKAILEAGIALVAAVTLLDLWNRTGLCDARTRQGGISRSNRRNQSVVLVFAAVSVVLGSFCFRTSTHPLEELAGIRHFEVLRAIQLTSGLSPILPIFFLLAAGLWWANHSVSGWILLDERCPRLPSGIAQLRIGEDDEIAQRLLKALRPGFSSITHYLALLGIALGASFLTGFTLSPIRTIEPLRFDRYQLLPLLVIASAGLIGTTLRLWTIWFRLRQLLLALDSSPLRRGFDRLEGFTWKPIWKFGGGGTLSEYQRILAREREALQSAANALPELENPKQKIDLALQQTRLAFETAKAYEYPASLAKLGTKAEGTTKAYIRTLFSLREWAARRRAQQKLITQFGHFQERVALAARDALVYLAGRWQHEKEEPKRHRGQETAEELKVRACERFVSLVYVSFLLVALARMRSLIIAISGMYILILLALTLYPFEPRPAIQIYLIVMLVFIVSVVGLVFAQIHRDATLSHITDTTPGELGADFYLRMASFVALPLFTFFASQFPEIGRTFYSWLEPALQALNR
jgi:hypothetical protein